ncbi:MAG: hypothetical protein ACREPN_03495 [Rudaea sp.]
MTDPILPFARRFSTPAEQRLAELQQIWREAEPILEPCELERLDAEAITDRRVFKRRFGYDWPLRFHREALVKLRQQRDWTDKEVWLFLLSGTLRRGTFGVKPAASAWTAAFGVVLVSVMLVFTTFVGGFFVAHGEALTLNMAARGGAAMLLYLGVGWVLYQLYVRPWRIQRRDAHASERG